MGTRKLSAGDTIEARCTRCREARNHTIVAMVGEKVVRVECNTCGGVHNYKPVGQTSAPTEKPAGRKTGPAPRRAGKGPGAADRKEWESLRPDMQRERAVAYDMNGKYKVDDLVEHPVFGLGVVKSVGSNKIEVLFQEGRKLLRCQ